jgi:hypothetical protein
VTSVYCIWDASRNHRFIRPPKEIQTTVTVGSILRFREYVVDDDVKDENIKEHNTTERRPSTQTTIIATSAVATSSGKDRNRSRAAPQSLEINIMCEGTTSVKRTNPLIMFGLKSYETSNGQPPRKASVFVTGMLFVCFLVVSEMLMKAIFYSIKVRNRSL